MNTMHTSLPAGWTRIDGEAEHANHPDTFDIPCVEEIKDLVVGDYVKVGIRAQSPIILTRSGRPTGERFWVKITEASRGRRRFVGRIDNDLWFLWPGIKCGHLITFEAKHILATHEKNKNSVKYENRVRA